jgi:mono/diheme cytochrome c family protein
LAGDVPAPAAVELMMTRLAALTIIVWAIGLVAAVRAQSADPSLGRHLAETVCGECHQIDAAGRKPESNPPAPSFVDISRMPSTTELAIKVFLRSSHPHMPDLILSAAEIDSVAAYILGLAEK